jgi:hypothetical protein
MSTCSPTALYGYYMLCTGTASDLALAHKKNKIWIKYMHYKRCIRQWKHKFKDAQLFVARQLAQSGKQDKTFTCLSWYSLSPGKQASVKLHLCLRISIVGKLFSILILLQVIQTNKEPKKTFKRKRLPNESKEFTNNKSKQMQRFQ